MNENPATETTIAGDNIIPMDTDVFNYDTNPPGTDEITFNTSDKIFYEVEFFNSKNVQTVYRYSDYTSSQPH